MRHQKTRTGRSRQTASVFFSTTMMPSSPVICLDEEFGATATELPDGFGGGGRQPGWGFSDDDPTHPAPKTASAMKLKGRFFLRSISEICIVLRDASRVLVIGGLE